MTSPVASFKRSRTEEGYVLVSALWLLGVLAVAISVMSVFTVNSLSALGSSADAIAAEAMARSGVEGAVQAIRVASVAKAIEGHGRWRLSQGIVQATWRGESGRVDLNTAPIMLVEALIRGVSVDEHEAGLLIKVVQQRRQPAPNQQRQLAPFRNLRELIPPGVTRRTFDQLRELVTVDSGMDRIDPRLASRQLLESLPDLSAPDLRHLIKSRQSDSVDITSLIPEVGRAARFLTTERSAAVRINVDVALDNGYRSAVELVLTMFDEDTEPYRILTWMDRSNGNGDYRLKESLP